MIAAIKHINSAWYGDISRDILNTSGNQTMIVDFLRDDISFFSVSATGSLYNTTQIGLDWQY